MRPFIAFLLTITIWGAAFAQGQTKDSASIDPNLPTRVFAIHYVDWDSLTHLLSSFGVPYSYDANLRAIAVHGPAPALTAIDEMIKQFDVPANAPKNVELTAYVVAASSQEGEKDSIPPAIKPVVDQLRNVMAYKSYRVVDTIITRGVENANGGGVASNGLIPKLAESDPSDQPVYEEFGVRNIRVSGDSGSPSIHLDGLRLTVKPFIKGGYQNLTIMTALDVKPGQQVVVGKAALQDRALILILSGKVIN